MRKTLCAALLAMGVCVPAAASANPLGHWLGQAGHWAWTHLWPKAPIPPGAVTLSHTLTTKVFTSAASGATLQTIKTATTTFTVTKVGAASLMVASGAAVANAAEYVLPTREVWKGLDYRIDEERSGKLIDKNVADAASKGKRYAARYCLLGNGEKELIPAEYERCPRGQAEPITGEEFAYR